MIDSLKASPSDSFFTFDELYEREYCEPTTRDQFQAVEPTNTKASLNAGLLMPLPATMAAAFMRQAGGVIRTSPSVFLI